MSVQNHRRGWRVPMSVKKPINAPASTDIAGVNVIVGPLHLGSDKMDDIVLVVVGFSGQEACLAQGYVHVAVKELGYFLGQAGEH